jgi:hypothetical protein
MQGCFTACDSSREPQGCAGDFIVPAIQGEHINALAQKNWIQCA